MDRNGPERRSGSSNASVSSFSFVRIMSRLIFLNVLCLSWVLVWLSLLPAGSHGFPKTTAKPDFYSRKMRTYFAATDANTDGYISAKDYDVMAKRLVYYAQLCRYDAKMLLYKRVPKIWNTLHYDKEMKGRPASMDEMIASLKDRRVGPELNTSVTGFAGQEFDIVDIDSDGKLSPTEHGNDLKSRGVNADSAKAAFASIDRNGDGFLDRVEYLSGAKNFFTSLDENCPSKDFYGTLL